MNTLHMCIHTHILMLLCSHFFCTLKNICRQTSMSFLRLSNSDLYLFKYFFQFLIGVPMRLLGRSLRVTTQQFLLTTTIERNRVPSVAQRFKDLAVPQLWHRLQLWLRFNPWPRNFHKPQVWPKKEKKIDSVLVCLCHSNKISQTA